MQYSEIMEIGKSSGKVVIDIRDNVAVFYRLNGNGIISFRGHDP